MKSIYTYYDYRRFISDYYQEKKKLQPFFSYRYIASKVGLDHALVVKIFQGQRHISTKSIAGFSTLMGLSSRQTDYFRLLVNFGRAKTNDDRKLYFEKILAFSEISERLVDATQYEFYQHWYYTVIREIINIHPVSDDFQWLSEAVRPAISVHQAKKAVRLLEQLGMIRKDENGYYRLTEQFVTTGDNWHSIAVRSFQKEACTLASHAIDEIPKEERDISTVTVTLNEEGFTRVKKSLSAFRKELVEIAASCSDVDRTCQINLQLFPVSRIIDNRDARS